MIFQNVDMEKLEREMQEIRRDFHKYPESGWTEFRTTARIIDELEKYDCDNVYLITWLHKYEALAEYVKKLNG